MQCLRQYLIFFNRIHTVSFTNTVYIERTDFRKEEPKNFFRRAPGKSVGLLKVAYPLTATSFEKDSKTDLVTLVRATYDKPEEGTKFTKLKRYDVLIMLIQVSS